MKQPTTTSDSYVAKLVLQGTVVESVRIIKVIVYGRSFAAHVRGQEVIGESVVVMHQADLARIRHNFFQVVQLGRYCRVSIPSQHSNTK